MRQDSFNLKAGSSMAASKHPSNRPVNPGTSISNGIKIVMNSLAFASKIFEFYLTCQTTVSQIAFGICFCSGYVPSVPDFIQHVLTKIRLFF